MSKTRTKPWMPPRWTPEILADEPPHGVYLRLCDTNGIARAAMMHTLTGVRGSRVRAGLDLGDLARIAHCDVEDLRRSAYRRIRGEHVQIRGNTLRLRDDLFTQVRRVCPECLASSRHHRFWWDITFVETCPEHGRRLVSWCSCGGDLTWNDGLLTTCFACEDGDVLSHAPEAAEPDVLALDRWILSRFDIGEHVETPAVLEGLSLSHAIDTIERVAALDMSGYSERWVEVHDLGVPAATARAHGFRIIRTSQIAPALERAFQGFLETDSDKAPSLSSAYGWFWHWLNWRGGEQFSPPLAQIMLDHALTKFQVPVDAFPSLKRAENSTTLSDVAKQARTRPGTIRKLLEHEGGIRSQKRKGSPIKIEKDVCDRLIADLHASVPLARLPDLIGTGMRIVKTLVRADVIPFWIPGGAKGTKHRYVFRLRDVEAWLAKLASSTDQTLESCPAGCIAVSEAPLKCKVPIEKLIQALSCGDIVPRGRVIGERGLSALVVTISDLKPLITQQVRRAPYRKRGPYKKKPKKSSQRTRVRSAASHYV
ncbi:hypothetical protein D8770_24595 [Methylobacterium sp. DB1607]|nr:hypothetical protein [Methylobacterium sp. DB1607]